MIEIKNLSKRYSDGTKALEHVSLKLKKRVTCILGRNGAGKTTLTRIMSTQLKPSSGTVVINGLDIRDDVDEVRGRLSSIPQEVDPWDIASPEEHIMMYLTARGIGRHEAKRYAEESMKELGLWEVRDKAMGDLSGGMKRKCFVAMALASQAEVIFLDEPTTGLDPISRIEVWAALRKIKGTIVITTHYMEEAKELSDEVVLIDKGRPVMQGSVEELLRKFKGKVRVEGPAGRYRIGGMHISYLTTAAAKRLVDKGYTIKQVSLEDLFIIHGGGLIEG
ncbi:MAG: ABC transporter ATP-binding protein [Candidatus Micrarchaeota archaeon]|nr:ABC transporter ATP-binding protein [Candidatus Micrarchaeota archaeon]